MLMMPLTSVLHSTTQPAPFCRHCLIDWQWNFSPLSTSLSLFFCLCVCVCVVPAAKKQIKAIIYFFNLLPLPWSAPYRSEGSQENLLKFFFYNTTSKWAFFSCVLCFFILKTTLQLWSRFISSTSTFSARAQTVIFFNSFFVLFCFPLSPLFFFFFYSTNIFDLYIILTWRDLYLACVSSRGRQLGKGCVCECVLCISSVRFARWKFEMHTPAVYSFAVVAVALALATHSLCKVINFLLFIQIVDKRAGE